MGNVPKPRGAGQTGGGGRMGQAPNRSASQSRGGRPHAGGGGTGSKGGGCCPMAAAVRSVKDGKYRLARRYAVMSIRLIAARAAI